jgi:hypothetical protein
MLDRVINRLNRMSKVDATPIIQSILQEPDLQKAIIYKNTIDQLFERGEDSLGRKLEDVGGSYSPYTIMKKLEKGQPFDRVTLKDTGEYYDSYRIVAPSGADYIMIITNPIKEGKNIEQEWGGYIVGLNQENKQWLIDEVRERFVPKLKEALLQA